MKTGIPVFLALALFASAAPLCAQEAPAGGPAAGQRPRGIVGEIQGEKFKTTYIRLGQQGEGLLYEPTTPNNGKERIALVFTHPGANNFTANIGREMASRGYRVMNINYRGDLEGGRVDIQLPTISAAVAYLRTLPGVQKVIVTGHSGGAHQMALYENVAENGVSACNGPEKVYPCRTQGLEKLEKPDGLVLLDPPLGAFHEASSIDPAVGADVTKRDPKLDMFSKANGFDAAAGKATYSAEFAKRYYAAQVVKTNKTVAAAQERLKAIEAGKSPYSNDEPFIVPGLGADAGGARLYQSDLSMVEHTKAPHLLIKADGTRAEQIIHTVRPANFQAARDTRVLGDASQATTVTGYLSHSAIRLLPDFAISEDDIVGVDWKSAFDSGPGNAYGINRPTLVLAMGCHYLMVPGELYYDRLPAKDKTMTVIEGATHGFTACKPQYGDTTKRTFDYLDEWLSKAGRF